MTERDWLDAEKLPVLTVGECRMWNFRAPGVDIESVADDDWIFLPWDEAYRLAIRFLEKMEIPNDDIATILGEQPIGESEVRVRELSATTRRRLYDVHRIRLALLLLYPEQQDVQRVALHSTSSAFGSSLLQQMIAGGTDRVRRWLEGRLTL